MAKVQRMRQSKEETSCTSASSQAIDLISAVKELNRLSSQELSKLLRDSENYTIHYLYGEEIFIKIDVEKLAGFLPLHLMAVLISSDRNEALFRYLLCGIRLLHSLCELAPRHSKLEQILLDDVKVSEQLLDMLFYLLIVLGGYRKENHKCGSMSILHSALVACSLYLLMGCISSQWPDVVHVLLAHPKVDIFIEAAFRAVHEDVSFLEINLSAHDVDTCQTSVISEEIVNYLCLQCEASLQFLQTLCQQKVFRERLLRNKELCSKGGVLFLARTILKINITRPLLHTSRIVASVSRLKAKVLSILLSLCEAESISYLDEVASSPRSLELAKSVALQVLEILNAAFIGDHETLIACSDKSLPMGFLQLNAMRLADIFSDDSNFRAYITNNFTKVLATLFSLSHGAFLSSWCSSDLPVKEEDATLEYDSFAAAGWIVDSSPSFDMRNSKKLEFVLIPNSMHPSTFAHQRTSLLVKIIANLHCFVPSICEEQERNLFLRRFVDCLKIDTLNGLPGYSFTPDTSTPSVVCRNLRSLLSQAQSLIPNFLNEEDVHLLRVFFDQLQKVISSAEIEANQAEDIAAEESMSWERFSKLNVQSINQDDQSAGCCIALSVREEPHKFSIRNGNLTEGMSENSAFREVDFPVEIDHVDQSDVGLRKTRSKEESISRRKTSGGSQEDDRDLRNIETSGSDTNSARGRNNIDQIGYSEITRSIDHVNKSEAMKNPMEDKVEAACEEKHRRKRKRTIMNDKQMKLIERALLDEPEMQRHATSIQSWADKLSLHGSDVTSSQLKNWLNNRKARLARTAKDVRTTSEIDPLFPDKQGGVGTAGICDSPDSPDGTYTLTNEKIDRKNMARTGISDNFESERLDLLQFKPGQNVVLVDVHGLEVAKARIYQVQGKWNGRNLDELETFVVDVDDLKAERDALLPYPSDLTGSSFHEAETKLGIIRILWDSSRIFMLQSQ